MKKSDSIRHDSKPLALGLAALGLCTAALVACGGGGTDTGPSGPPADTSKQYVGFYQEDPGNNPEDPMPGTMIMRLPADSGSFEGQMPFSYIGCQGGADVGTVSGTRTAQTLAGNWTGSVDGVAVGGSYNGTYSAPVDQFSGTYVNAGGKVPISGPGGCHYSVAAFGTWRLFGDAVHQPANFLIGSSHGTSNTLTSNTTTVNGTPTRTKSPNA